MNSIWAIVPAAGRGTRVGGPLPKQYLTLHGRSILEHTLHALTSHPSIEGVTVAIAADDVDWPHTLTSMHGKPIVTCVGGATRAESVRNALQVTSCKLAVVHDAARPLLNAHDLQAVVEAAKRNPEHGAILASPVADTLKRAMPDGTIAETVDRSTLWRALTPQVFQRDALLAALDQGLAINGSALTDEASAMERIGIHPMLVEGSADNFKITTVADIAVADALLTRRRDLADDNFTENPCG